MSPRCTPIAVVFFYISFRDAARACIVTFHLPVTLSGFSSSYSSWFSAGRRLTPHSRTLDVRPGRITKKLELHCDYDVNGMILNYYSVSQMYDLVLSGDRLDSVVGYNSVILPPDR